MTVSVHGVYSSSGKYASVPFVYDDGLLKTTEPLTKGKKWNLEITVNDNEGNTLTQGFVINVTEVQSLSAATSVSYDRATQTFTVVTKNNVRYSLTASDGTVVSSGLLSPLPQLQFSRSDLKSGDNVLNLQSTTESINLTLKK